MPDVAIGHYLGLGLGLSPDKALVQALVLSPVGRMFQRFSVKMSVLVAGSSWTIAVIISTCSGG